jgi:hypothetical protein
MKLQKVEAVQDESSHWYVIPADMSNEFSVLHNKATDEDYDAQEEFIEKFDQYRTGGDLNNIQLYAEL